MSSKTTNLNLTKPSEDEFYDINVQNENMDIIDREINGLKQPDYEVSTAISDLNSGEMITVAFGKIAKAVSTLISHVANKSNPHGVTKNQIGLGNVPNVATNDQTPTYTEASSLSSLVSGEKTSVAFGKIAKAVSTLISHTTSKATNSVLGHVKLSDSTSSTSASTAGVAATPKAVKAAYDLANSNTKKIGTTDISGIGDGTVTGAIAENKDAIEDVTQSLANQEKYIFISVCSAVNTNVIKRFTLNGSDFEIYLAYTTETSATIAVTIDGIVVNLLGVCWIPGTSNQPSYVNTTNLTMQITSYFEAFTYTKLGYKISAILIGGAGQPTAVFSIESYKLI